MAKKTIGFIALLIFLVMVAPLSAKGPAGKRNGQNLGTLTDQEIEDLVHLREEEKLARDVYRYLYGVWGQWIFDNIASSEQRHMDAVKNLLDKYGIVDPVENDVEGVFDNGELQALYYELITTGELTRYDALWVGATIEDMDIFDIKKMLENTKKPDLISVYENLMKGSRNHLRSFCSLLETLGESYEAQYLEQDEVDAILSTPKERGRKQKKMNH